MKKEVLDELKSITQEFLYAKETEYVCFEKMKNFIIPKAKAIFDHTDKIVLDYYAGILWMEPGGVRWSLKIPICAYEYIFDTLVSQVKSFASQIGVKYDHIEVGVDANYLTLTWTY
jgi:hypothetical protein